MMRHKPWPQWICDTCGLRVTGGAPDDHECDEVSVVRREMEAELAKILGEEAA
jgi:ribosomal protein L37AE/L43A